MAMWNYVWRRSGLLSRVRLNTRWMVKQQRQLVYSSRRRFMSRSSTRGVRVNNINRYNLRNLRFEQMQKRKFTSFEKKQFNIRWKAIGLTTTTFCLGFGSLIIQGANLDKVKDKLYVPSKEEVDAQTGFASVKNAQFVHGKYDELINEFLPKFSDPDRQIVKNLNSILNGCNKFEYNFWKGKVVCEIGSGTGLLAFPILDKVGKKGGYIGLDISSAFVRYLNGEFRRRDIESSRAIVGQNTAQSLCLPDELKNGIDVFVICDTYYHLDESLRTAKEIYGFLKPGGKLIVIESKNEESLVKTDLKLAGYQLKYEIMQDQLDGQFAAIFSKP